MLRFLRRLVAASSFSNQKKVLIQPSSLLQKHQWSKHHNNVTSSEVATHVLVIKSPIRKVAPLAGAAAAGGAGGAAGGAGLLSRVGSWFGGMMGRGAATKPATGFSTKTLENASTSAGKQSMTNLDGGGAVGVTPPNANPIGDAGGEGAAPWMKGGAGFDAAQQEAATSGGVRHDPIFDRLAEQKEVKNPTAASELDDVPIQYADPATMDEASEIAQQAAKDKSTYNIPKPLQRIFGETIDRDKAQNIGAMGIMGYQQHQNKKDNAQAKQQAEMERIQGLAEDGKANSTTGGGKVAVTA